MKVGNWYYITGRHTRSDRVYKEVEIDTTWTGFKLVNKEDHYYLEVIMTDEEIDSFISKLENIKRHKSIS